MSIRLAEDALCSGGHRYPVVDGIPVLVLDQHDESAKRQHAHQEQFYGRVFETGRPYLLENWQKAYIRRMDPLWAAAGADRPFLDSGAGGDAYTIIEALRRMGPVTWNISENRTRPG